LPCFFIFENYDKISLGNYYNSCQIHRIKMKNKIMLFVLLGLILMQSLMQTKMQTKNNNTIHFIYGAIILAIVTGSLCGYYYMRNAQQKEQLILNEASLNRYNELETQKRTITNQQNTIRDLTQTLNKIEDIKISMGSDNKTVQMSRTGFDKDVIVEVELRQFPKNKDKKPVSMSILTFFKENKLLGKN